MASVRVAGRYITNSLSPEPFKAFIPYPLPPEPPLNLSGTNPSTVTAALTRLEDLGIVREVTSRCRDKLYSYEKYIHLLNEGTEPLAR